MVDFPLLILLPNMFFCLKTQKFYQIKKIQTVTIMLLCFVCICVILIILILRKKHKILLIKKSIHT